MASDNMHPFEELPHHQQTIVVANLIQISHKNKSSCTPSQFILHRSCSKLLQNPATSDINSGTASAVVFGNNTAIHESSLPAREAFHRAKFPKCAEDCRTFARSCKCFTSSARRIYTTTAARRPRTTAAPTTTTLVGNKVRLLLLLLASSSLLSAHNCDSPSL